MLNRFTTLSLLVIALTTAACGKKDDAKKTDTTAAAPAATTEAPAAAKPTEEAPAAPAAAPAGAGPVKTEPKALFAEFGPNAGGDPMALLDKYHDGATFTAKVKAVGGDQLIFDVDGKNTIMAGFTDPSVVKGKKAGDSMTVTCKIGGEVDAMMQVTDCTVAK